LDGDKPVFLWNHYMDVHGPYEPPEPYRSKWADGAVSDSEAQDLYQRTFDAPESISERERQLLVDLYDGEIRYTDAQIGSFLERLDERGLLDDALIIISSDHGDGLGEDSRYGHPRRLHEELVRVPMVVSGESVPATSPVQPVSTIDIYPTIMKLLGLSPSTLGVPFQAVWEANEASPNRKVICEARGEGQSAGIRRFGVYDGEQSLQCETTLDGEQMVNDDGPLAQALIDHLEVANDSTGTATVDSPRANIDDRLESLGYK
jgi:arylsulfatase